MAKVAPRSKIKGHSLLGRNERLEFPLVFVDIKHQPVHDLVLLLWGDEVLDYEVPAHVCAHTDTRTHKRIKFRVTLSKYIL